MGANRIFSRFAELLDIAASRAAVAWLRLNADGTVSERTAAQTLGDLGAASSADLAFKANIADPTFTGTVTAENLVFGGLTMYGTVATFTYLGGSAATHRTALGLGTAATSNTGDFATAAQGTLAGTALQPGAIGVTVQGYSAVLAGTTASFLTAQETKLGHISVTQAVDLDQMETDIAALANGMVYKGDWDASAGTFPGAGAAQIGWFYNVSVAGTVDGVEFTIGDSIIAKVDNASTTTYAGNWVKKDQTDAVQTVAGRVGNVVITSSDLADFDSAVAANAAVAANTAKISFPGFSSLSADYSFTDNSSNWNTAYGWGNHASAGYAAAAHTHNGQIQIEVGNGVDVITTGVKRYFRVPYGWTIIGAYVTASPSGSIVFDIWRNTVSTDPETDVTVSNTITASAKPTLSSDTYSADTTLTGWTTTGTAGQWMAVKVDSATTITKAMLTLSLTRT